PGGRFITGSRLRNINPARRKAITFPRLGNLADRLDTARLDPPRGHQHSARPACNGFCYSNFGSTSFLPDLSDYLITYYNQSLSDPSFDREKTPDRRQSDGSQQGWRHPYNANGHDGASSVPVQPGTSRGSIVATHLGIPGRIQDHFSSTGPVELAAAAAPPSRRIGSFETTWGVRRVTKTRAG